jgi:hypothetical protein
MPLFGCPLVAIAQRAPTTSAGIIQRPPRPVQSKKKRGGATRECNLQLRGHKPRALRERQVLHISNIQREATERPASPAAHSTEQAFKLTDESSATRGRVHADVRLPLMGTTQRAPLTATGIIQRPPRDVQKMRKRGGMTWDVSLQLN